MVFPQDRKMFIMPKTYKIIIYDPMLQVKSRVRIHVNMKIDDVAAAIRQLFESKSENVKSMSSELE
jgi:hypothetical protein